MRRRASGSVSGHDAAAGAGARLVMASLSQLAIAALMPVLVPVAASTNSKPPHIGPPSRPPAGARPGPKPPRLRLRLLRLLRLQCG